MARWDPGTEERLTKAALELYREHGYDHVTVTQIAERAGITRRSYFRYFPDKREVLFAGSGQLPVAVAEAVLDADGAASPLSAALDALARVGTRLTAHVDHAAERRAVIDSSQDLQERERTKLATITTAIRDALLRRGVDADTAGLVAQLATVAFQNAFARWVDAQGKGDFPPHLWAVAATLRDTLATTTLGETPAAATLRETPAAEGDR
ncbi:helix-turn-helix domain-containing protein [Streptomyces sp. SL13]|jgi:AcrR family transcriptional regulator|uniref:Helix-turn-helix domain-containing protein n=1 Tax=Streptantibioticus silvisoli TaxID=2705255 RepID=A0AA90H3K4_9ACTN|nr:TetR/AcrR family transcriptional regulator [Streptantibioticus silvisoli]MDI5963932.1 helix-turn-helix domain-containing protein [Streptantibioticus silvisoli]MDI5970099.1 helix-turn-helix domain-containing protein [Streptantibioticus silvisoli]